MITSEEVREPVKAKASPIGNVRGNFEAAHDTVCAALAGTKLRVLVVEDDPADVELVRRSLQKGGFELDVDVVQTAEDFAKHVRTNRYDVILADYGLPSWNGRDTLEVLRREGLDVPVVVVSGSLGELKAVECIKQGAADYVLKDHLPRLPESVRHAIREKKLREEHRQLLEDLARSNRDLEQFAYVASHDLQEPLRMVATYTQLLAERYQGKLDANADKYIHYAVDGALRMQTLVHDLLAFSRVGRQGTDLKVTDCNAIVETALQNLHAAVKESNAEIVHTHLPAVLADSSQLATGIPEPDWQCDQVWWCGAAADSRDRREASAGVGVLRGRQRDWHCARAGGDRVRGFQTPAHA